MMNYEQFILAVQRHAGDGEEVARRAAEKTLGVFGELLTESDQKALADELPDTLADAIQTRRAGESYNLDEFYRRIDIGHDQSAGFQVEHAQAVLAALADVLDRETRVRLQKHLPDEYKPLLEPREIPEYDGSQHHDSRTEARKLSTGKPGPEHPISEAESDAQSGSVVESENPHGDRKLSTGKSSPNEGHDLATGKPDPEPKE